ncbi:DUF1833 family protein [Bradyrhizobium sp. USDA 3458]|uniref:DUF1833 family protein n=1 Tax=Bradyrhizobium sp. USDA 3458 TaxID=2591461 RepID=UPI00132F58E2|nr:DUF1833 family protein [Bradyrhizobium sp. USDA 3458]
MAFSARGRRAAQRGETVTFIACPFEAAYPEQKEGQQPSTTIKIDNINRELVPKIRAAQGTREYIKVLYREYLGSDLTMGRSNSSCAASRWSARL